MPHVIVTAHESWGGIAGRELAGTEVLNRWAERLDELDGSVTQRGQYRRGGPIRHVRVPNIGYSSGLLVSSPEAWGRAERAMLWTCTQANRFAMHGPVLLAYGHGVATEREAWVDLAPGGMLRVTRGFFEEYASLKDAGARAARGLNQQEQLFELMGSALAERPRVRRIDLYTCAIGLGPHGRALLDWIHHFWGIPVRGLRGDLVVEGHRQGVSGIPSLRVLGPPGARGRGYDVEWVDRLLTDDSLWTSSRAARPAPAEAAAAP